MMIPKITKAVGGENYVELILIDRDDAGVEKGDPYPYALYEGDPYGLAPELRVELQRMVEAGEIVIEEPEAEEPAPEE